MDGDASNLPWGPCFVSDWRAGALNLLENERALETSLGTYEAKLEEA